LRVALVHDWLLHHRGGEKVLATIARLYPQADLFTLLADRAKMPAELQAMPMHTSWLQRLPGVGRYYRKLLPWMPGAIERFRLEGHDLVISSSHCVAKGANVPSGIPHICYCHTPMRYAWDLQELYLERVPKLLRGTARQQLQKLQQWDRESSSRVTHFIANGRTVQQRIKMAYGRESTIIHPPVDVEFYQLDANVKREGYYLIVSALAPNKRIDLAISACQQLKRKLIIIGSGPEEQRLRSLAADNVQFLGWATNEQIRHHLQRCTALLFPGEEDFGIVPLEANACGCPVIAYAVGGATETIKPMGQSSTPTGLWFTEPTASSLIDTIERFEQEPQAINAQHCRANAEQYSYHRFLTAFKDFCTRVMSASGLP
jgi:glycosyltransferase involved in cell wall biosynthesis